MANAPKMEDFPTITKWLEALEKYGDAKRGARTPKATVATQRNNKKDPNKYDRRTQYTRYRTGPPVKPSLKYGMEDWHAIPRNKREKINKEYRASLRDWGKTQKKSEGISRKEARVLDSLSIDRMDIGLGSLSNLELTREIARSPYKGRWKLMEEFEKRRGKGDTTLDDTLRREEKDYKDYLAKNPPKIPIKLRKNKGGGQIKKYSYRRGGLTTLRKPKRG